MNPIIKYPSERLHKDDITRIAHNLRNILKVYESPAWPHQSQSKTANKRETFKGIFWKCTG